MDTLEKSHEQAAIIKLMEPSLLSLDIEFLKEAYTKMVSNHNTRESMAALNPNPFTHNEKQELNSAKLDQLSLLIQLSENVKTIVKLQIQLMKAEKNANNLEKLF